jgi:hypothetical protein
MNGISVRLNAAVPPKEKGDLNGDSKVTIADAVLSLKWVAGLVRPKSLEERNKGDVNGDGAVTITDTLMILKLVAGVG